jgi:hypothetical protein
MKIVRGWMAAAIWCAFAAGAACGCANVSAKDADARPFYQQPYEVASHGRKDWWDRIVELDPSGVKVAVSPEYKKNPPERIAVLPFVDDGSAQYVVDKLPMTDRNKTERERWAWTDAQRLRLYMVGYLAQREFTLINPIGIDAVLASHGIDDGAELNRVSPQQLGAWLGADAVVYGEVTHYEGFYLFLVSAEQVSIRGRMVSTHDGKTLIEFSGGRYHVNPMPAIDPIDMAINSAQTLIDMRDVNIARAEDEACREVVVRIPRSRILERRLAEEALAQSSDAPAVEMSAPPHPAAPPTALAPINAVELPPVPPAQASSAN